VLANAFASSVAAQQDSVVTDGAGTTYIGGAPSGASAAAGASALPPGAQAGLVATINFGHGSSRLGSGDLRKVREVATTAKQSGRTVRVVGHSSQRTGNMSFERHLIANFNISMDRANAVARALAEAGVPAEQIVVEAVGDQQPVYFEFMPNGEAENRRAEIFLE
jgi:outer membrane protein OmpA-like peptidoglycan-associated protein